MEKEYVNGMENKADDKYENMECKEYKPSYDDLKIENERLQKKLIRLQRLVFGLEEALGIQADEIIHLEQDIDSYKEQYYRENQRANKLFDKLYKPAKMEEKNNE